MKLIRLTRPSDEPVYLDAAHITSIWPSGSPGVASFVARDNGGVLRVKEAPDRVRAMLGPADPGSRAAGAPAP